MPKLRKYVLAALLTAVACAAMAQTPAPHKTDTVYDTVWDTVMIPDTVRDTIIVPINGDPYYELAKDALDFRKGTIDTLWKAFGVVCGGLSVILAVFFWLMQRSREVAASEARHSREDLQKQVDQLRSDIRQALTDVREQATALRQQIETEYRNARDNAALILQQARAHGTEIAAIKTSWETELEKVKNSAAKSTAVVAEKPAEKPGLDINAKLQQINLADAGAAVEQYEKLLSDMMKEGVPLTKIPSSLHRNVGLNYYRLKRYEKALSELLEYLKDTPNDEDSLFVVAYAYHELQVYETATKYYERVTVVNPANSAAFYNCGLSLGKLYDATKETKWLDLAIQKFERTVTVKPDFHWAFNDWGVALGKLYDAFKETKWLNLAIQKFERAVAIKSDFPEAFGNWSVSLIKLYHSTQQKKYLEEALTKSSRALELAPDRKDYKYNIACELALLGRKDEMLTALKEAIAYDNKYKKMAREDEDKDFKAYWNDPDFIALTKEDGGEQAG